MKESSDLQVRQARFKDRWIFISKLELIVLFVIFIVAVPYCLLLADALFKSNLLWLRLVGLGIVFLLIPLPLWKFFSSFLRDWSSFWIAEQNDRVIAIAKISQFHKYCTLDKIRVKSRFRRQSIGSTLIKTLLEKNEKPIYAYVPAKALDFFRNLGFTRISRKQTPKNIKFEFNKLNFDDFLYIAHFPSCSEELNIESQDKADFENKNIDIGKNYKARPVRQEDLSKVRKLISISFDLFLPFGFSLATIKKAYLSVYLVLFVIFIFFGLSGFEKNALTLFIAQVTQLILFISITVLPAVLFTSIIFGPRDWSKFWLLEYEGEAIGYARVSRHQGQNASNGYGVIEHVFVNEFHRHPLIEKILVERILKYAKGAFLISTSRERLEWLSGLGFQSVKPVQLPAQYQLGGKVNTLMKGINLVCQRDSGPQI